MFNLYDNPYGLKLGDHTKRAVASLPSMALSGNESLPEMARRRIWNSRALVASWFAKGGGVTMKTSAVRGAVAVVVVSARGEILTVTRRSDLADIGLPGGKHESGESLYDTAVRETYEETGLRIATPTFDDIVYARNDGFRCVTFLADAVAGYPEIHSTEEGKTAWSTAAILTSPACTFANYNRAVINILRGVHP